ncbi:hypothetical protein [Nostoc sp. 'Peltigera membranacea cyanobiont' 213]|uniref:hypothetical protein n=1 Tax=Nostoc sp. 'Peltigera membranacea cyanobiont' 213 TaxID=2014530 RepID=UPI00167EFC6A|nr:hypothetical protein [Nostoc sp. 'Peltigera membranacea cyanobiont' 213]
MLQICRFITDTKYLSNSHISVPRQLLQVGEPQGRTGNSIASVVRLFSLLNIHLKGIT